MYDAASRFPNKYNRIRIQNGAWSTSIGIGAGNRRGPSFGEGGGLVIEPDEGHNPIIDAQIQLSGDRIVFRNLTFTWTAETDGSNVYIFEIRSTSGYQLPEGVSPGRFIFEDNRFGGIFKGQAPSEYQKWPWILRCNLAWSFVARRNTLRGTNRGWYIAKALVSEFYGNDYGESTNNPFSTSQVSADGENGYDKLPTNDSFIYIHQELHRGAMDLDPALGTHMDFFQVMPYGPPDHYGTINYWIEDCLVTGSQLHHTVNQFNQTTVPATNMLIYTVFGTEAIKGGLFNNICSTNGFFVQAGNPLTSTDVWFNTAGVQPVTPRVLTSSDGAAATQYFYGTGEYRSGYNIMRPSIGTLPSTVADQVMTGFPGALETERPEYFFTGNFPRRAVDSDAADPNGVSYWQLPQIQIYEIDPAVLRAAIVNQFQPRANVTGGASFTVPQVPQSQAQQPSTGNPNNGAPVTSIAACLVHGSFWLGLVLAFTM